MKAQLYDRLRTLVKSAWFHLEAYGGTFRTEGTIVEVFEDPEEYAVDVDIPDEKEPTGYTFDNLPLTPEQFEVIRSYTES